MNCKVEYIEQAYRTVHSEFADALTNAHHSIFNRVKQWNNENPKASFTRKESDDSKVRFTFATNGSAAQKKQAKFVQQLNRENPSNNDVPVIHSVGRELRVNVLRGTNAYWKKMNTRSSYIDGKDDARGDLKKDVSIKERIFKGKEESTIKEVLLEIQKNPVYSKIASTLLKNTTKTANLPIYLLSKEGLDEKNSRGLYYPSEKIEIAEFANAAKGNMDGVMLHEIIHALTIPLLERNETIAKDWVKLWEYAKDIIEEDHYGLKNEEEFASELFVNSKFILTLKKYPASNQTKYKNLWEEVLTFIKDLLGFQNESLYDEAVAMLSNIIEQEANTNYQRELEEEVFNKSFVEVDENDFDTFIPESIEKQSPSLTTEQTTQIEELKQSDVRWNISSNFVRNVNELGEQFEESLTSISTPTKVLKELENKLINGFLKDFNIDVTEYENFKQEIGFDAYSASDLVTKAIAYQKGESILPEVAYFAYSIMGKQNNKIKSQLKYLISKWDKYNERFEHHKQTVNKNYGFIKDVKEWRQKVSDLVILDFLKENIENHYFNPQAFTRVLDSKWTSEDFTIWQKFMNWIENLLSSFSSSYKKKQQILNNIGISIADEVLNQNYTYFNYPLKKEQVQKYYKETIETDDYAKELVEFGQSIGLVLTGSLALRKAGSVYRTLDETIHDVDFVVPFEKLLNQPQLFEKVVKNRLFEKEAFEKEFMENIFPNLSWLKEFKTKYPEYRVLAAFIGSEHAQNKESMSVGGVIGGEFYTEDGTHVEDISYYTKNKETKAPVKVTTQKTVLHKKGDWIKDTGYVVDFFVRLYPKQEQHENYFKLWKEIMIAKLKMGREKDLIDWKAFIPFTKSLNSFNFNYEGFRHINFDSSQKYQVNATNIKSTIVSESFKEEKGESNTECFL